MDLNGLKMDLNGSKMPKKFQSGQEKFSKYITHQSRVITCVGRRELELNSSNYTLGDLTLVTRHFAQRRK